MTLTQGDRAIFDLTILSKPEPIISVYHGDSHMDHSERVFISVTQKGDLWNLAIIVEDIDTDDAGKISIVASNEGGQNHVSFMLSVVKVSEERKRGLLDFDAAQILEPIKDQVVMEGETANLHGQITGYPSPELVLLKNGKEVNIQAEDRFNLTYSPDGNIDIQIHKCSFADDDEYSLLVENIAGVDSCNFEIFVDCPVYDDPERYERRRINKKTRKMMRQEAIAGSDTEDGGVENPRKKQKRTKKVFERSNSLAKRMTKLLPPKFDRILSDHDAVVGENVVMSVATRGVPQPEIHFYQDGKMLSPDDKVEIRNDDNNHMLILKDIQKDEEAEYACRAVNIAGEAWCFSDVVVRSSKDEGDDIARSTTDEQEEKTAEIVEKDDTKPEEKPTKKKPAEEKADKPVDKVDEKAEIKEQVKPEDKQKKKKKEPAEEKPEKPADKIEEKVEVKEEAMPEEKPKKKPAEEKTEKSVDKVDEKAEIKEEVKPEEQPKKKKKKAAEEKPEKPADKIEEKVEAKEEAKHEEKPKKKPTEEKTEKPFDKVDEKVEIKEEVKHEEKPKKKPAEEKTEKPFDKVDEKVEIKEEVKHEEKPKKKPDEGKPEKPEEKAEIKEEVKPEEKPKKKKKKSSEEKPEKPADKTQEKVEIKKDVTPEEKPKKEKKPAEEKIEKPEEKVENKEEVKPEEKPKKKTTEEKAEKRVEKVEEKVEVKEEVKPEEKPKEKKHAEEKPEKPEEKVEVKEEVKPEEKPKKKTAEEKAEKRVEKVEEKVEIKEGVKPEEKPKKKKPAEEKAEKLAEKVEEKVEIKEEVKPEEKPKKKKKPVGEKPEKPTDKIEEKFEIKKEVTPEEKPKEKHAEEKPKKLEQKVEEKVEIKLEIKPEEQPKKKPVEEKPEKPADKIEEKAEIQEEVKPEEKPKKKKSAEEKTQKPTERIEEKAEIKEEVKPEVKPKKKKEQVEEKPTKKEQIEKVEEDVKEDVKSDLKKREKKPEEKTKKMTTEKIDVSEKSELKKTERSPSPSMESARKKKSIPKPLVIPDEIHSRFGDPSTLHSETNITTKITAREGSAEVEAQSPMKKPQSASISMRVKSRTATPEETAEFSFKQEGVEVDHEAKGKKSKKELPPIPKPDERDEKKTNTDEGIVSEISTERTRIIDEEMTMDLYHEKPDKPAEKPDETVEEEVKPQEKPKKKLTEEKAEKPAEKVEEKVDIKEEVKPGEKPKKTAEEKAEKRIETVEEKVELKDEVKPEEKPKKKKPAEEKPEKPADKIEEKVEIKEEIKPEEKPTKKKPAEVKPERLAEAAEEKVDIKEEDKIEEKPKKKKPADNIEEKVEIKEEIKPEAKPKKQKPAKGKPEKPTEAAEEKVDIKEEGKPEEKTKKKIPSEEKPEKPADKIEEKVENKEEIKPEEKPKKKKKPAEGKPQRLAEADKEMVDIKEKDKSEEKPKKKIPAEEKPEKPVEKVGEKVEIKEEAKPEVKPKKKKPVEEKVEKPAEKVEEKVEIKDEVRPEEKLKKKAAEEKPEKPAEKVDEKVEIKEDVKTEEKVEKPVEKVGEKVEIKEEAKTEEKPKKKKKSAEEKIGTPSEKAEEKAQIEEEVKPEVKPKMKKPAEAEIEKTTERAEEKVEIKEETEPEEKPKMKKKKPVEEKAEKVDVKFEENDVSEEARTEEQVAETGTEMAFRTCEDEDGASFVSRDTEFDRASMFALGTEKARERKMSDASTISETSKRQRERKRREGFVSVPDKHILSLRGDDVKLECEVANEEDEVEWFINKKPASDDARTEIVSTGSARSLIIRNVVPNDNETTVTVSMNGEKHDSKLFVEETPVIIEETLPRKTVAMEGEDLVIRVKLNHGTKDVTWFKDGEVLSASFDYDIYANPDDQFVSLTIKNSSLKHAGRYSLHANGSEISTNVEVHGKPVFPESGRPIEIECQENLAINLVFKGEPEPIASILLNGEPIPSETRSQLDILSNTVRFCKRHATKKDSGEYTIKLENEFGEAVCTVPVIVKDVPNAPETVSAASVANDSVSVEWTAPSNDGGAAITGYLIEKKELGRRAFHKVAQVSSARSQCDIDDLVMDTEYIIRVAAINKYGTGDFMESPPIKTGTPYSKPVVAEAPLVIDVSDSTVSLEWNKPSDDGGSPIYAYDIYVKERDQDWKKANDDLLFVCQFTVTDLKDSTPYRFKIEAVNEAGMRSSSNVETEPVVLSPTQGKPTHVLNIPRIVVTDVDSVSVDWDVPSDVEPTEFTVAFKSESSSVWAEVEVPCPPANIRDLKEGITYVFKVAPRSEQGVGEYSETTSPVRIAVSAAPAIIKPIKDATIPKKSELHLEVHATGEPAPEYIWSKDDQEIIPQDDNTEILNEGHMSLLRIHKVDESHAGKYACEVVNDSGSAETSANISIGGVRAHFESSFSEETVVDETKEVVLRCEVSDEDASVIWVKDGREISPSANIQIIVEGKARILKIKSAQPEDGGNYRCETSDGRSRAEGELIVKEEEPRIRVGPQDRDVSEFGETVTLTSELTKPARKVKWFKNGAEIWPQMHKTAMYLEEKTATLVIRNFDKNDVGSYTVSISDKETSAPAKLTLNVKPIISLSEGLEKEVVLSAGKEFNFALEYEGNPEPSMKMFLNGEPIQRTDAEVNQYEGTVSVRIKNIKRSDSGIIRVIAANENGETIKDIHISVLDVPSPPLNVVCYNTTSSSTHLSWEAPEECSGSPITGYIIERRQVEHARWRQVGKARPNHLTFEDDDMFSGELYTFRVLAVNDVGVGHSSETKDVLTLSEPDEEEDRVPSGVMSPTQELEKPCPPVAVVDGNKVILSWDAVPGACFYRIERRYADTEAWIELATTDRLQYTDRSISETSSVAYRIVAHGESIISPHSEQSNVVTVVIKKPEDDKLFEAREEEQQEMHKQEEPSEPLVNGVALIDGLAHDGTPAVKDEILEEAAAIDKKENEGEEDKAKKAKKTTKKKQQRDEVSSNETQLDVEEDKQKTEYVVADEKLGDQKDERKQQQKKDEEIERPKKKTVMTKEELKPVDKKKTEDAVASEGDDVSVDASLEIPTEETRDGQDASAASTQKKEATAELEQKKAEEKPKKKKGLKKKPEELKPEEALDEQEQPEEKVSVEQPNEAQIAEVNETEKEKEDKVTEDASTKKEEADVTELQKEEEVEKQKKKKKEVDADKSKKDEEKISEEELQEAKVVPKKQKKAKEEKPKKLQAVAEQTSVTYEFGVNGELVINLNDIDVDATWTKDGRSLDHFFEPTVAKNKITLRFKANENIAGKYNCQIKTVDGQVANVTIAVAVNEKPQIEVEESVVEVKAGETVKLYAGISGMPPPSCSWTKDGKPVKADKTHSMTARDGVAELQIKNCQPEHAGTYTLVAKNDTGETNVQIKLKVKGFPSAPTGPVEVSEITTEGCTLSWQPPESDGGSPVLGYCIEKKDAKKNTWAFVKRTTDTTTELTGMTWDVDYLFRISAENSMGAGPEVYTSATIRLPKPAVKPMMAPPKPTVKDVTKDSATVEWKEFEDKTQKPTYLLEFKEVKSKRSWSAVTKDTITTTTHTAKGLKKDIEYQFRVSYVTEAGSGPASEPTDIIKCEDKKVEKKPEITKKPDDLVVAKEKVKVKMAVEFTGEPQPEVHWFKNKKEVFSGKRQWIETSSGASSLTIGEMREDDEGEISVVVKNNSGQDECSFKLSMDAPALINRVDRYNSPQLFDKGEAAKLRLSFAGRPLPIVEWLDNKGQPIQDGAKYKVETQGANTCLIIKSIETSDRGDFTLKVSNRCGSDSVNIGIQVTDRPEPPGRPSVQDQNVDSVKLLWAVPKHDGGSAIRNYTVEMSSGKQKTWTKAEMTKQPFTTLFNLVAGETYRFRIRADNTFGISEPSEESEPVTVKEMTRQVVTPPPKDRTQEEPESVDYDKLDTGVSEKELNTTVDLNRLPNDLQAKYIICEELGRGAYGTVYRAIERATGKTWAAKMVQVRPGVKKENVLHEMSVMNDLHHDKLLHLHEAFDLGNEMCLIEEFVSGGELFDKIMEDDSLMSEQEVKDYMHQILLGLQHMHRKDIVHLDLKPENILLKAKNSTDIKIIDFGLARKLDPKKSVKLLFGTPEFCAPEVVNYQPVGLGTDMWTVGVISYVLLSGLSPFLGDSDEDTLANVSAADWDFDDPSWEDVSDLAKDFICKLMVKDKRKRMTVSEALQHPWISGPMLSAFNDLSEYVQKKLPKYRGKVPLRQKRDFMSRKRWSDDLLPIGRMVKRGAIFRRLSMDGVFERNICFDTECAPSIRKRLEDIFANVGDLIATLSCDVDGIPSPRIKWFKDQRELNTNTPKYTSRFTDGIAELMVKNIEESDAGVYTCRATNELGSIETEAKLVVKPVDKKKKADTQPTEAKAKKERSATTVDEPPAMNQPPLFKHTLFDQSIKLGETKILSVTNTTLPEPTVKWYKNGKEVHPIDNRYMQKHDKGRYELEILCCEMDDDADWKAVGTNAFGECDSSCHLTVEVPDDMMAPNFIHPLYDVRCDEMERLKLEVKVEATPLPEISWFRNGIEIQHCERYRLEFDDELNKYSMTIVDAYAEDSGEYVCVAKNRVGREECSCMVTIKEPEQKKPKKIDDSKAPKFRMHLPNPREAPEGTELVMVCAVAGEPEPKISWLKDEKRMDMDRKAVKFENGVVTLYIFNTEQPDSGVYTCVAENLHGSATTNSQVEITPAEDKRVKPRFVEPLMDASACEGNEIVMECQVQGTPLPTLAWYKDGLKLIMENRMLHYVDRRGVARLNIMNVLVEDAGEYSCEAVNSAGKDFTHCTVKVVDMGLAATRLSSSRASSRSRSTTPQPRSRSSMEKEEERAPVITRPLSDTTVYDGNRELLEIEVDGAPQPTIEWYKNGKLVAENRLLRTYFDGRVAFLKIYEANADHEGEYVCKVANKLGTVESRAMLTVARAIAEDDHVSNMPKFVRKLDDVDVEKSGDGVTLTCQAKGEPQPEVCWLHNGRAIHHNENIRARVFDDNVTTLEILKCTAADCGTYTAVATNQFGDAHTSATIKLLSKEDDITAAATLPYFIVEPKAKVVVEEGTLLNIVCDINGTPKPEVCWLKDNAPFTGDARAQLTNEGVTYQLVIAQVSLEDAGTYTVTAENEKGKVRQNCEVQVVKRKEQEDKRKVRVKEEEPGAPSAPDGEPQVSQLGTHSLNLEWKPPTEDGGSAVQEYEVQMRKPDRRTWTECDTTTGTEVKIRNLEPNTEYLFRVRAKNSRVWGPWSSTRKAVKTLGDGIKPKIVSDTMGSLQIEDGQRLELKISFEAEPEPKVKWYRNGVQVVDGGSFKVVTDQLLGVTTLIVDVVRKQDHDGTYSCYLENASGFTCSDTKVTITTTVIEEKKEVEILATKKRGPPEFVRDLTNETVMAGQPFTLQCRVSAQVQGETAWFKDEERITPSGRYEIQSMSNGLQILICHAAQTSDSGVYKCVATNEIGVCVTQCDVDVHDLSEQKAPKFDSPLTDKTGVSGNEVTLKCRVSGFPEPQIMWMKDGERITTSRHFKLSFGEKGICTLTIHNVDATDTGVYLCTATNKLGVDSTQCLLFVAEQAGYDSHLVLADVLSDKRAVPKFIRAPAGLIDVQEGNTIKLVAKASGEPQPRIIWKKDGKDISRTNRMYQQYLTGDGESHLVIEFAVVKTSGIFQCIAENSEGSTIVETQIIVSRGTPRPIEKQAPIFTSPLKDMGVVNGHPVSLVCKVKGVPEPELRWYFIDDNMKKTCLTSAGSGWVECRGGETAELKCERVFRNQQGTYECVATNQLGESTSQCYLLVGSLSDEPAGPPRFVKCLRDIWTPLGEDVVFEVEIAGYPLPELNWYHNDYKLAEGKNVEIRYVSDTKCEVRISQVSLLDLGTYSVEAHNVHGVLRTNGALNVGKPRSAMPPEFKQVSTEEQAISVQAKVAFAEPQKALLKSASTVRMELKKKGAAPVFVQGLEDLDLKAGDSAAFSGKLSRKPRQRAPKSAAKGLAASIIASHAIEADEPTTSTKVAPLQQTAAPVEAEHRKLSKEDGGEGSSALDEIRNAIQHRNRKSCRPKFMVKPKPKKQLEELKSLRLKCAISANPLPTVYWDRNGMVLETGNKYSIYNDGDFYYLEVHHVSIHDQGFYNCTATNSEGIATSTSEVEVVKPTETSVASVRRRSRKEPRKPQFIEVLPGKLKATAGDQMTVECSVSGYPSPSVQWMRNGNSLMPQADRYQMSYDGECATLKFAAVSVADEGVYRCIAANELGEATTQMSFEVDPGQTSQKDGVPPLFKVDKIKEKIKAKDGEPCTLRAEIVQGSDPMTIRWIKDKMTVTDSQSFHYRREGGVCSLVIADAFPEDAGEYHCEARNQWGVARCMMRLSIRSDERSMAEESPRIADIPKTLHTDPGMPFEIRAKVSGHPDPVVEWFKGKEKLTNGEKYEMLSDGNIMILIVNEATRRDSGKYKLSAVNVAGTASAVVDVTVREPSPSKSSTAQPKFSVQPVSVQSAVGQQAQLRCQFTGTPMPTVSWFKEDKLLQDGHGGYTIETSNGKSVLSVVFLEQGHLGEYLCTVRNPYGEDLSTARILLEGSSAALPQRRTVRK